MAKIGFIGLGTMGGPMAQNLVKGGHEVSGFDIDKDLVNNHVKAGGLMAGSSAEAAAENEFVFTMLPTHQHLHDVIFGKHGAATHLSKGSILIDMSTVHPFESDKIREKLLDKSVIMIDAPIGRTSKEAAEGKSLLMVGANKLELEKTLPLFNLLGDTIIDCGGPGTGARMKIINNYMTTILNVLSAEALTLASSLGIETDTCLSVLNQTPAGRGHLSTTYPAKVLRGDISPAFMIDLALKDLKIGNELAEQLNIPLSLGVIAKEAYLTAQEEGRGKQDWTAIYQSLLERAKITS